jgi:tetratricopeptide (TPR) repeat protein
MSNGDLTNALTYFDKAISIDKENINFQNNRFLVLISCGKHKDIKNEVEALLEKIKDNSELYNIHGIIQYHFGNYNGAKTSFLKSAVLNPNNLKALNNVGLSFVRLNDFKNAIHFFDKVLEIDEYDSEAIYNKADALSNYNEEEALIFYDKIIQHTDPRYLTVIDSLLAIPFTPATIHSKALNNKGILLNKRGDFPNAISCYRSALSNDPDDNAAKYNLFNTLLNIKDYSGAEQLIDSINDPMYLSYKESAYGDIYS